MGFGNIMNRCMAHKIVVCKSVFTMAIKTNNETEWNQMKLNEMQSNSTASEIVAQV